MSLLNSPPLPGEQDLYSSPEISGREHLVDLLPSSKGRRRKQEDPEFSVSTAGTQGWDSGASSAHPPKLSQVPVWGQEGQAAGTETGQDFHLLSCLPKNPTIPVARTCLRVIFCLLRAAPRAQRAPGLPRALQQCPVSAGCPQEAGAAGIDAPEMGMRKSHLPPLLSASILFPSPPLSWLCCGQEVPRPTWGVQPRDAGGQSSSPSCHPWMLLLVPLPL